MFTKNDINISILIPCYNWDIFALVDSLQKLCEKSSNIKNYEILCIEDASTQCFSNHKIANLKNVTYDHLSKNVGRSKIRNLIAKKAIYNWLLFIDADHKVTNINFIENYIKKIITHSATCSEEKKIYYGSTTYPEEPPVKNKILHWKYGKKIESKRKKSVFSSHHFLIPKTYFTKYGIMFNESITTYGYEDVFLILDYNLKPVYIENPLLHIGIKTNSLFIQQTESAIENLMHYYRNNRNYSKTIRIINTHQYLSILKLKQITLLLFRLLRIPILKNLNSHYPLIWLFQFYKLGYLLELEYKNSLFKK